MSKIEIQPIVKPLLRGHFHQAAFFFSLGACALLISLSHDSREFVAILIYSLCLCTMFGVSALYHRPSWQQQGRMLMRRLDHSAIYLLIAGTSTPICLLAISENGGMKLLTVVWIAAVMGIFQSLFWVKAPKWFAAILYLIMGWLAVPYAPEMKAALGTVGVSLIVAGGIIYSVGALIYAVKRPNPWPKYFGYHEIFHLLTIVAAALHFVVIRSLLH